METDIGGITQSDLFTAETKRKAAACKEHWSQVIAMQTAFAELNVSVSSELAHIASNMPPVQGANGEPQSPDKAAGDTVVRNPLLEPNPPPPIFGNAASTTPIDVAVPAMPLAAAAAAEVAVDGKTDDDMSTPEPPKRMAEQSAMACAQNWIKMVRVSSSEEKGKGKGKSGSQVKDEDAEA